MIERPDFEALSPVLKSAKDEHWADYEQNGVGMTVLDFDADRRKTKPHRYKAAKTNDDDAPELTSVDAQGRYAKEHGTAALVDLLGKHGLTPGRVKKVEPVDGSKIKGENNPYSENYKGTPEKRQAAIATLLRSSGTRLATDLAKAAGKTIDGKPLRF